MSSTQSTNTSPVGPADPVTAEQKEFLAEIECMDLSPIKDKVFIVSVSRGQPDQVKFLCTQVHGPYNFSEMCQEVGDMWTTQQHHAKVVVLDKDVRNKVLVLSDNTVDYIECHYNDIILEEALTGYEDKEYTCVATTVAEPDPDPSSGQTQAQ